LFKIKKVSKQVFASGLLVSQPAKKYVGAMLRLEWMYMDQMPMSMNDLGAIKGRTVVLLLEEWDGCFALLRHMFEDRSVDARSANARSVFE
jgi:hypothetical protein